MSYAKKKNSFLSMDVIRNVNYFCYWDHSRFYDEYLKDATFSKAQFKQMMHHEPCHEHHLKELIRALVHVEELIPQQRSNYPKVTLVDQSHVDDANTFQEAANG